MQSKFKRPTGQITMSTEYKWEKMSKIVTNGYDRLWQRTRASKWNDEDETWQQGDKMKVSRVKLEYNWFEREKERTCTTNKMAVAFPI